MQQNPFISIIIPVYQIQAYISRCLESCINQTFKDIEIIIVDDCGTDNSILIAKEYAHKDSRIKIIHNSQNMGTFHSRIIGSKKACGKYICYLDGDDFLDTKTCEISMTKAHILEIQEKNLPDIIHFGMQFFPPDWKRKTPNIITKNLKNQNILKKVFLQPSTPPWHICSKIYKKDLIHKAIQKLDFVNERLVMAEDVLKTFVITLLAKSSCGVKNKFYFYCENTNSITRQINPIMRDKRINDLKKIINILEHLQEDNELSSHQYFYPAKNKIQNILLSVIELEYRFDETKNCIPAYLKACLKSLRYYKKWQTYARIIAFIISFGKIKF
ncbi:glycosyltransferase family 2 protein [Helicobacter sp. 13S00477-4]|uniref:glycosyltransferase family 2 protein n=1 Tax=Helicobacter sp. 13S00477-4 TaxID=1905759 RepID=UPI000BA7444F|nr:glycosyltransferase family 2 protein [Helicobacter sp. 13S00477-4]PAF51937.1 hypothetical protein BKH44_04545 [Helicobacter sp. 13S00477-4]